MFPKPPCTEIIERDPALDGVRGVAVAMIVILHGFRPHPEGPVSTFLNAVIYPMFLGVDLFFVLSGFLITSILIRSRDDPSYFRNFYARRALRIFPAYYLVLAFVFVVRPMLVSSEWQGRMDANAPYFVLYVQNLVMAWRGQGMPWAGLDHTWSLAIEEQFYLVWPAVVWFSSPTQILRISLLVCLGSIAIKFGLHAASYPWWTAYAATFAHAEGLAGGAALAAWSVLNNNSRLPRTARYVGVFAGICLMAEIGLRLWRAGAWPPLAAIHPVLAVMFFVWLLSELVSGDPASRLRRFFQWPAFRFLGRYSYGLYLIHFVVLAEVNAVLFLDLQSSLGTNAAIVLCGALMTLVSLPVAMCMFHVVEQPALRLKRYFVKRPAELSITETRSGKEQAA